MDCMLITMDCEVKYTQLLFAVHLLWPTYPTLKCTPNRIVWSVLIEVHISSCHLYVYLCWMTNRNHSTVLALDHRLCAHTIAVPLYQSVPNHAWSVNRANGLGVGGLGCAAIVPTYMHTALCCTHCVDISLFCNLLRKILSFNTVNNTVWTCVSAQNISSPYTTCELVLFSGPPFV